MLKSPCSATVAKLPIQSCTEQGQGQAKRMCFQSEVAFPFRILLVSPLYYQNQKLFASRKFSESCHFSELSVVISVNSHLLFGTMVLRIEAPKVGRLANCQIFQDDRAR